MALVLYDLVGVDDRRFSPHCWRTQMAMAHKGLAFETLPTPFTGICDINDGQQKTLPVIEDNGRWVGDSGQIAEYLEAHYPEGPSLFGPPPGRALSRFVEQWVSTSLQPGLISLIILDIYRHLRPEDQGYFRTSREQRLQQTLEEAQSGRENRLESFQKSLHPLRFTLKHQPFIGGDTPLYGDYAAFGAFQWARIMSTLRLLQADDPINGWFERCLDLFDGLGRRAKGYY